MNRIGLLALAAVVPHLAELPCSNLYLRWQEILPILAAHTRADFLADFRELEPILSALGGEQALTQTVCAIQDVGRWWP